MTLETPNQTGGASHHGHRDGQPVGEMTPPLLVCTPPAIDDDLELLASHMARLLPKVHASQADVMAAMIFLYCVKRGRSLKLIVRKGDAQEIVLELTYTPELETDTKGHLEAWREGWMRKAGGFMPDKSDRFFVEKTQIEKAQAYNDIRQCAKRLYVGANAAHDHKKAEYRELAQQLWRLKKDDPLRFETLKRHWDGQYRSLGELVVLDSGEIVFGMPHEPWYICLSMLHRLCFGRAWSGRT